MTNSYTLIDGGLSTAIERLGGDVSGQLWTAGLAVTDPDKLLAAHRSFVEAGAEVIAGNRPLLEIALSAGYGSGEAFARAFRAFHGLGPDEARRAEIGRAHV